MSKEKLMQAMQLLQECMDEYQGDEEEGEGEESMSEESQENESPMSMGSGNDKVRMAAALMKRKM